MTFIFPINDVIIIGDLFPAAVLMINGMVLLPGFVKFSKSLENEKIEKVMGVIKKIEIPIGIISLLAGIIHVFIPFMFFL